MEPNGTRSDLPANYPYPSRGTHLPERFLPHAGAIDQSLRIKEYLYVIFKRKFTIFFTFCFSAMLLLISSYLYIEFFAPPPVYKSSSLVLVKYAWEQTTPDLTFQNQRSEESGASQYIESELQIMDSPGIKEETLARVGVGNIYPSIVKSHSDEKGSPVNRLLEYLGLATEHQIKEPADSHEVHSTTTSKKKEPLPMAFLRSQVDPSLSGEAKEPSILPADLVDFEKYISSLMNTEIEPSGEPQNSNLLPLAFLRFDEDLSFEHSRGNVIKVSFQNKDPRMAARVVNTYIDVYLDKRINAYMDPRSIKFLDDKLDEYHQNLEIAQDELEAFKSQFRIINFDEEARVLLQQRIRLEESLQATKTEIAEVEHRLSELKAELARIPKFTPSTEASESINSLEAQLVDLRLEENDLLTKYKPHNRLVINVRNKIRILEEYLGAQDSGNSLSSASDNPVYQEVQTEIVQTKAQLSSLKVRERATEEHLQKKIDSINFLEKQKDQYTELSEKVADYRNKYRNYQQRIDEVRLYEELQGSKISSVNVLDRAATPIAPVEQRLSLPFLIKISLVLSLGLAFGLAFLLEFARQTLNTPLQAEMRLTLPVLSTIPYKKKRLRYEQDL